MSAARSIYIEAPVEKVFDFFEAPGNWLIAVRPRST